MCGLDVCLVLQGLGFPASEGTQDNLQYSFYNLSSNIKYSKSSPTAFSFFFFFFFLHTITLKERKPYGDRVIILLVTAFRWLQIKKKDCQQMYPSILPLLHLAYYSVIAAMPASKL